MTFLISGGAGYIGEQFDGGRRFDGAESGEGQVPTIAYFLGISVRMFFNDHDPPHFHVTYQGYRARVSIADGEVIDGKVPLAVARILKEWAVLRREELMRNWVACRTDGQIERIEGLDT